MSKFPRLVATFEGSIYSWGIVLLLVAGVSCSQVREVDGTIVHRSLYELSTLDSWVQIYPKSWSDPYDILYVQCPGEKVILVAARVMPETMHIDTLAPEKYVDLYRDRRSPLYEPDFRQFTGQIVSEGASGKLVEVDYIITAKSHSRTCDRSEGIEDLTRVKDVIVVGRKHAKPSCLDCTQIVVMKYLSDPDHFEQGLPDFRRFVESFKARW